MAFMAADGAFGAAGDVPQAHGVIVRGGGEEWAGGAEGAGADMVCMAEDGAFGAAGDVPQAYGFIARGGGEELAVGAEGAGADRAFMAAEDALQRGMCLRS